MNWYTSDTTEAQERLIAAWSDAPTANLETLGMLLEIAREQVWLFAPESGEEPPTPPGGILDQVTIENIPDSDTAAGTAATATATVTRIVGDVLTVDLTITNPTAANLNGLKFLILNDSKYQLQDSIYTSIGALSWTASWLTVAFPYFNMPPGKTNARFVAPLVPGAVVPPPPRLVYAQLQQAKNLWNAGRVDSNGNEGGEGFMFTPRPLDKTIRGIIRPVQGVPDVG